MGFVPEKISSKYNNDDDDPKMYEQYLVYLYNVLIPLEINYPFFKEFPVSELTIENAVLVYIILVIN